MSIDAFYSRTYNRKTYNCAHFVCEVWKHLTGNDIAHNLAGFLQPPKERKVDYSKRHYFERIQKPVSPCLVLMARHRSAPHVGIYLRGKVFHIHENGVELQPLDVVSRGFTSTRFYKC